MRRDHFLAQRRHERATRRGRRVALEREGALTAVEVVTGGALAQAADGTVAIAESYKAESDATDRGHEVVIVSEPDNGLYDAMNKGLRLATGDYVVFLNAGDSLPDDTTLEKISNDVNERSDGKLPAVLYGDTADGAWYFQLLKDGRDIHDIRDNLVFGNSHLGDVGHKGNSLAAGMPDSAEVCGCNGVCKGTIVKAIQEQGLFTLEDVRKHTKASSSCGSCTGLVEQILASTVGGAYQPADSNNKAVCGCTDHSHGEVRKAIKDNKLLSVAEAQKFLGWKTPNGCASCRPALNYYCISTWPHEAIDDPQSRFINERAHANIQKDGTYSVVPRMWGGLTTPTELRAIADAAEKYKVPTVKVTGGQRIDLLGVKKEDLPAMWSDFAKVGMVSGHAYGKSLRTVKTCVGAEHCRFGTQRSMDLGVKLEKMLFGMWSPHKFKLAVSGCPRNCAESGIKDIGVIGVDSGYELYVGGNGGIKTEVAQFFCKVRDDDEVLEYGGAFIQLYREEGYYLERTCHYIERVGLEHIKQNVLENASQRKELYERLLFSLQNYKDPWAEIFEDKSGGILKREFEIIKV